MAGEINKKILKLSDLIEKSPTLLSKLPMKFEKFKKALFLMPEETIDEIMASAIYETTKKENND